MSNNDIGIPLYFTNVEVTTSSGGHRRIVYFANDDLAKEYIVDFVENTLLKNRNGSINVRKIKVENSRAGLDIELPVI